MNDMTQPEQERGLADILAKLGEEPPELPVDTEPAAVRPQGEQREPTAADDVLELDGAFDYEGYQVVRREFFAHTAEPSVTFNNYKFYVNAACLRPVPERGFCSDPCQPGAKDPCHPSVLGARAGFLRLGHPGQRP